MKLNLLYSFSLHTLLMVLFFASKATPRKFEGYPTVVPVELVQLKEIAYEVPDVQRAQPKTVLPKSTPQKLEGVTIEKPVLKKEEIKSEDPPKNRPEKPQKEEPKKQPEQPDVGKSTVGTEKVKLDAEEFPFSYYLALLQSRIQANWEPPFRGSRSTISTKVVVFFEIQRSGRITSITIEKSSGDYLFDQSALRAVTLANPLAPLPADYPRGFLGVHFEFEQGM